MFRPISPGVAYATLSVSECTRVKMGIGKTIHFTLLHKNEDDLEDISVPECPEAQ